MSDTKKKVFYIQDYGDPSVGIFGGISRVTFDDYFIPDQQDRDYVKKMLADYYDVPVAQVYTQKEWNLMLEEERKMAERMEKEWREDHPEEEEL